MNTQPSIVFQTYEATKCTNMIRLCDKNLQNNRSIFYIASPKCLQLLNCRLSLLSQHVIFLSLLIFWICNIPQNNKIWLLIASWWKQYLYWFYTLSWNRPTDTIIMKQWNNPGNVSILGITTNLSHMERELSKSSVIITTNNHTWK